MAKEALMNALMTVTDPRAQDDRLKHKLEDILTIVFCGLMSACEDWEEIYDFAVERREWFEKYLEFPNGIPSADTLARVVGLVSYAEIERRVRHWVKGWREAKAISEEEIKRDIIALDGKALRGSRQASYDARSSIMLVTACLTEAGICLATEKARFDKKDEHEKGAFEKMVEGLFLKDAIVTIDANGATAKITNAIEAKGGDWLIGLKNNQRRLLKVATEGFAHCPAYEEFTTEEKGHGRREKRFYKLLPFSSCDIPSMRRAYEIQKEKWPGLKCFVRVNVERTVIENGIEKTQFSERFYFTSLKADVSEAARAIRSHWAVENKVHWILDVAFREDHWRARALQEAENLGALRRLALNMVRLEKTFKGGARRKMKKCALNQEYLAKVLMSPPAASH